MKDIGRRIRHLRQTKNIPLKELAAKTNLTASFLSQLENGMSSPSVESLSKIAAALETAVGYFFQKEEPREFVFLKRQDKNKVFSADALPNYEMLASSVLNIKMLPVLMRLKKAETIACENCPEADEMLGVPVRGKTGVAVNDKTFELEPGDSMYLIKPRFQYIKNLGDEEISFLWILLMIKEIY